MQNKISQITGLQMATFSQPPLPGSSGLHIQFVLTTLSDYKTFLLFGGSYQCFAQ
jgi:hypothetical protein